MATWYQASPHYGYRIYPLDVIAQDERFLLVRDKDITRKKNVHGDASGSYFPTELQAVEYLIEHCARELESRRSKVIWAQDTLVRLRTAKENINGQDTK